MRRIIACSVGEVAGRSFGSQGFHGVHARRVPGWHDGSYQAGGNEQTLSHERGLEVDFWP
jgi:hypothetical protein